jgi:hypothetical protein
VWNEKSEEASDYLAGTDVFADRIFGLWTRGFQPESTVGIQN